MEFRIFPKPKPLTEDDGRPPVFGRRPPFQGRRWRRRSSTVRVAEVTALGVGAVVLAYLVVDVL
ncbi:hypothetical protein IHQ68_01790 [Chelatococcus sambhunathii]|uniref:Uncharacterized protein n=1 Tax=Chelatococcus sambhunathii TaxID=363953 RepID=A0ABU1DB55_9HYPH|nr:hypothetical protein [Chelatococcus sambhunathii]MDR4305354.1 hypothetical protein [Chelatococcus sambhunathii]